MLKKIKNAMKIFIIIIAFLLVGCNKSETKLINISDKRIVLSIGQERALFPIVEDESKLIWESSDPKIATVTNGKVKAISEGEVTITISLGKEKQEIEFVIVKPDPMSITIIGKDEIAIGEITKLAIDVRPDEAIYPITWSTSDPEIAEVSEDGTVTPFTFGTVTISAQVKNLTCKKEIIVLKDDPISIEITGPEDVDLENTHDYLIKPDPIDTCPEVYWETSDANVATIDINGTLYPKAEGNVTIHAISKRSELIVSTIDVVIYGKPTSIECIIPDQFVLGGFANLEHKLIPEDETLDIDQNNVILESSNQEVIRVDENGKVEALFPGKVTITIRSKYYEDVKITKEVEVLLKDDIAIDNILILPDYEQNEAFIYNENTYIKGHNAFTSINDAIKKASGETTIVLTPGTYDEEITISKSNITITGNNEATITNTINIGANTCSITLQELIFMESAKVIGNINANINDFNFLNNVVNVQEGENFLYFQSNVKNNENFIIENNEFTGENINSFILLSNIKNIEINNNKFDNTSELALLFTGSSLTSYNGTGATGSINIIDNEFTNLPSKAIRFMRYTDAQIKINKNTFTNVGVDDGVIYFEICDGLDTNIEILENIFKDIKGLYGIRFIHLISTEIKWDVKINYNQFVGFTNEDYIYIDNQITQEVDGQFNYFEVEANDENINNCNYENQFKTIADLNKAIKEKEDLG